MRSLQERKTTVSRYKLSALGALLALILFFVARPPTFLENAVFTLLRPASSAESRAAASSSTLFELLRSKRALVDQNAELRLQLEESNAKSVAANLLAAENETLRTFAGRNPEGKRVLAGILLRPPEAPYDVLVIDAGTDENLTKDDRVFAYGNLALGVIEDISANRARVRLYSSSGISTNADIMQATSSIAVTLIGQGGGNFIVQLPRGALVATDTPIALPGITGSLVGVVGAIRSKPADSFETALAKSPVNIRGLRYVEVERGGATTTLVQ